MDRTTVMLPSDLKLAAERYAKEHRISFGEVVRRALTATTTGTGKRKKQDPFLSDRAVYRGKSPADLSSDHDRYLYGDQ
jgi:hypothetical protein